MPVDFVAKAMDHIAHLDDDDLPGNTFHLVTTEPLTVGQTLNEFARRRTPRVRDAGGLE